MHTTYCRVNCKLDTHACETLRIIPSWRARECRLLGTDDRIVLFPADARQPLPQFTQIHRLSRRELETYTFINQCALMYPNQYWQIHGVNIRTKPFTGYCIVSISVCVCVYSLYWVWIFIWRLSHSWKLTSSN